MIVFDFHEMSWLELPVKSLGQKVFAGTGNFVKLIFWSFTFHARMVFCCGHFGLKGSITFVSQQSFPFVYADSLASAVGVVLALLPRVASRVQAGARTAPSGT